MMPFLLYQFKIALCIAAFTSVYFLLFRKETFYRFNRIYLLSSLILSVALPGLTFIPFNLETKGIIPVLLDSVTVYANRVTTGNTAHIQPLIIITLLYGCITFIFAGYLACQLARLVKLLLRSRITVQNDHKLIMLPGGNTSFSFFNIVFIHPALVNTTSCDQVIRHELAHARQFHSMDILILQFIKIFQWFNPFLFLLEKTLKETHEYLADTAVLEQDGRSDRYRLLLLTQVFGIQPGIFSFFNYSLIKNRLTMMTKEKSPLRNRLKYLAALPLILFLGLLMCCKLNKTADVPPPPPPPPPPAEISTTAETIVPEDGEPALILVEEQAKFQGGDINAFRDWVQKYLVYPPEAIKNGIYGRVTVQFAVSSKGKVCDIKVLRSASPLLDKESIRVMQLSPDWVPAKQDGKNVKQQFVMPVVFALQ